ncbi:MAG: penicillin-binding protein, partial [Coriobacteriales bacterium]|nr:penicillin-binding protein [Coriobacteriales bacterium]
MSTRYWNGRPRAKTHAPGFLALAIVLAIVAVAVAGVVGLVRVADEWLSDLPDASDAEAYSIAAPSQVYSADGVLLAEFATQNRTAITIDKVSPYVLNGTVDTEDVRFY